MKKFGLPLLAPAALIFAASIDHLMDHTKSTLMAGAMARRCSRRAKAAAKLGR